MTLTEGTEESLALSLLAELQKAAETGLPARLKQRAPLVLEHETTWTLPVWLEWSMLSPCPVSVLESSIGDASQSVVRLREVDTQTVESVGG